MSVATADTVTPAVSSPDPAPPRVRRITVRSWEPPYDDEVAPAPVVTGSLALAHPAFEPPLPRPLRLVPDPEPTSYDEAEAFGPQRTARAALPNPRVWTRQLVQALVEVLAGQRPAAQLTPWTTAAVHRSIERRVGRGARPAVRPLVRSVHVSEPAPSVVEACAVFDTGVRRRAVALRLEGLDGRWQCTALQL